MCGVSNFIFAMFVLGIMLNDFCIWAGLTKLRWAVSKINF
jgi:hypothetical protein